MVGMRFTLDQKCKELRRELQMRRGVYRREVERGRMKPQEAADRLAIIEEILGDYQDQRQPQLLDK